MKHLSRFIPGTLIFPAALLACSTFCETTAEKLEAWRKQKRKQWIGFCKQQRMLSYFLFYLSKERRLLLFEWRSWSWDGFALALEWSAGTHGTLFHLRTRSWFTSFILSPLEIEKKIGKKLLGRKVKEVVEDDLVQFTSTVENRGSKRLFEFPLQFLIYVQQCTLKRLSLGTTH